VVDETLLAWLRGADAGTSRPAPATARKGAADPAPDPGMELEAAAMPQPAFGPGAWDSTTGDSGPGDSRPEAGVAGAPETCLAGGPEACMAGGPRPRRQRWWLGLAAAPWIAIPVLLAGPLGTSAPSPVSIHPIEQPSPTASDMAPPAVPGFAAEHPAAGSTTAPEVQIRAVATIAARQAFSGPIDGGARYLDAATAEEVLWLDAGTAVVGVTGLLLEGTAERWASTRAVRLAVPLAVRNGVPVPAGLPWELAPPQATPQEPAWEPAADPALTASVRETLEAAGYTLITSVALARAPELPAVLRAVVQAVAPGAPASAEHHMWLRDGASPLLLHDRHDRSPASAPPSPRSVSDPDDGATP
jgi:hypothetical protein